VTTTAEFGRRSFPTVPAGVVAGAAEATAAGPRVDIGMRGRPLPRMGKASDRHGTEYVEVEVETVGRIANDNTRDQASQRG
jgi:hypothetical protein